MGWRALRFLRIPDRVRLAALAVSTIAIASIWVFGFFHTYIIKFARVEITPTEPVAVPSADDEDTPRRYSELCVSANYVMFSEGGFCFGLTHDWAWSDDEQRVAQWRTIPFIHQKWYRRIRNTNPWVEWNGWTYWQIAGFGPYSVANTSGLVSRPNDDFGINIPCWLLAITVAGLWLRRWRRWRVHRLIERGGCPDCGYDLRGSPAVGLLVSCPECGNATLAPNAEPDLTRTPGMMMDGPLVPASHATCDATCA